MSVQKSRLQRLILAVLSCLLICAACCAMAAAEGSVSDENLFDPTDPYYAEGYNFVESTDEIIGEANSFITGYIPVNADNMVSVNLNSTEFSPFIKYALYDANKNWIDTVKVNNISEVSVRIFEPGFIRVSVNGLDFKKDITIYISNIRSDNDNEIPESLLMTSNNANIVAKTFGEEAESYTKDWLDRNDPDFMDKHNYVQFTDVIVEESDSFISGYIPVSKGDAVTLSLNLNRNSSFVKFILFDQNKNHKITYRYNNTPGVTMTIEEKGYIRISVNGRVFKNTASITIHPASKLSADQQIDDVILPALSNTTGYLNAFDYNYLSEETINLFNKKDPDFLTDRGYRQLTDEIVIDQDSFLTGYIPVVKDQVIVVNITEDSEFAKYALFDKDKNWISTTRVNNPTILVVPIEETGFFRLHGKGEAIDATSITIPSVKKLDISAVSGDLEGRLTRLEAEAGIVPEVDLILFAGQSNMAGRGIVTEEFPEDAPAVIEGAGWEFRAISDPTQLFPIDKTFGIDENVEGAINDGLLKTGGLVPAFVNAYYRNNGNVPVVAVSASEGSTSISGWLPGTARFDDMVNRMNAGAAWLTENGYHIRHRYMVWCQGEADDNQTEEWYTENFNTMLNGMLEAGVEKCFVIRVGNINPQTEERAAMMAWQNRICQTNPNAVMISTDLAGMLDKGLMKDEEHYYQAAYNECGEHAGVNAAYYVTTQKEPSMYDPLTGNLYFSFSN